MSAPLFTITDLEHYYGSRLVLSVPSLAVAPGEAVGLAGPNGSGKSTLLRILARLETPSRGLALSRHPDHGGDLPLGPGGVTLLLQEPYLLRRRVSGNLAYGLKGLPPEEAAARARQALEWVGLEPEAFARRAWFQLSVGEARRVALAARLALKPLALLLDEPTAGVDAMSAALIQEAFQRARRQWGAALVVASHDLYWLHQTVDRVVVLHQGGMGGLAHLNLIPGPWLDGGAGRRRKELAGGQVVLAPGSIPPRACARLDPDLVRLSPLPPAQEADMNALGGVITHMSLEHAGGRVLAALDVGGLSLLARLGAEAAGESRLRPGARAWACFAPEALAWDLSEASPREGFTGPRLPC